MVEDINDQASDFTANSVALSTQTLSRLEDINTRYVDNSIVIYYKIDWYLFKYDIITLSKNSQFIDGSYCS